MWKSPTKENVGEKSRRKPIRRHSDELDVVTSPTTKETESLNNNEEKDRNETEEETEKSLKENSNSNRLLSGDSFMSVCQNLSNNLDFFIGGKAKAEAEKKDVKNQRRYSHQVIGNSK